MIFFKNSRGGREVNMINNFQKQFCQKQGGREGGNLNLDDVFKYTVVFLTAPLNTQGILSISSNPCLLFRILNSLLPLGCFLPIHFQQNSCQLQNGVTKGRVKKIVEFSFLWGEGFSDESFPTKKNKKNMGLKHWIQPYYQLKTHFFLQFLGGGTPLNLNFGLKGCSNFKSSMQKPSNE